MLIKNIKYEIITDLPQIGYVFKMVQNLESYYPNRYNFNISKVEKGIHRKGKLEYVFN